MIAFFGDILDVIGWQSYVGVLFPPKHFYAWDPKDLIEKLSLEIQNWITVIGKITVVENNDQNIHYHMFPSIKISSKSNI